MISFWLSGLIALTYAFFGAQWVVLRGFYLRFWADPQQVGLRARTELAGVEGRLRFFQCLAGLIPLAGALLVVGLGLEQTSRSFRLLAAGLIVLGMIGVGLILTIARTLSQLVASLTGSEPGPATSAPDRLPKPPAAADVATHLNLSQMCD